MPDPDVVPLLDARWSALDHRFARARLERLGWALCGEGDWAYAYRSPGGRLVARVSPFEPAYGYFVELCRRCAGNRYVPRIELATPLDGGGQLTVLEHLDLPDRGMVETFLRHWANPEQADADLRALRHEVRSMDEWGRRNVRWWGGVDIGDRHVLLSADGKPKLIDVFFVTGNLMIEDLINDPRAFARQLPADRCQYLLDIPDLQHGHPAAYLRRIREALEAVTAP